jgi:hypothetical protein
MTATNRPYICKVSREVNTLLINRQRYVVQIAYETGYLIDTTKAGPVFGDKVMPSR